jgi:hypothetical protein
MHTILTDYARSRTGPDVPEFAEHVCKIGYGFMNQDHFEYCMYHFYKTKKPNSARKFLEFYPHQFDLALFEHMCTDDCTEGIIHMIDMGIQLDWVNRGYPTQGIGISFCSQSRKKEGDNSIGGPPPKAGDQERERYLANHFSSHLGYASYQLKRLFFQRRRK